MHQVLVLLVLAALSTLLERRFPIRREEQVLSRETGVDLVYWLFGQLPFYGALVNGLALLALLLIYADQQEAIQRHVHGGAPWVAGRPLWLQCAMILLLGDFVQYWIHRGMHRSRFWWPFHAIHHSPTRVAWHANFRFHPVNVLVYSVPVNALMIVLGFAPEALALLVPAALLLSTLSHANVNWRFGPLRYVLVSPVFHHWHHTHTDEGGDANFAPLLALWDYLFGTAYLPEGRDPQVYGVAGEVIPENLVAHLAYPFRRPAR